MNRWLALIGAGGVMLAALIILPRLWRSAPASTTSSARPIRTAPLRDARSGLAGTLPESSTAARAGGGAAGRQPASADGATRSRNPSQPREGPDAADHALPAPGSIASQQTADGEPTDADAIPEVAYQSKPSETFDTGAQAELSDAGPISGEAGTVAFWLKPQWGPNSQDDANFVQFGDSGLQVIKNVNFLRFEYVDPRTGQEYGLGTNIADWQSDAWRHITATWTGSSLALYVDGKLISEQRFPTPPDFQNETKVYVGSSFPSGATAAPGVIGAMTVLNRGTSGAEVSHWYGAGPPQR